VLTALKMVDRYGYADLSAFKAVVTKTTRQFDQIYSLQSAGVAFESPEELWSRLGLKELTQRSFEEEMSSRLSSSASARALVQEMLFAVNKVNYNQTNAINGLAGMGQQPPLGLLSLCSLLCSALLLSVHVSPRQWRGLLFA
jgi:hypothetical protein